ncbi:PaaI family thioesterase [Rhodopseudomonas sp. HC1]|uniref:PaaI family thioesterase n=1 Tax=Rhodopseudomonas infernalis TaxID=2897386 RepID=UPI001EE7BA39|nr:PaaI family thioesterase [Rhodopseudomonas infernalis]MCG6205451.1 PaaI family thioesterase [Rhodopseudomonas infernalis]
MREARSSADIIATIEARHPPAWDLLNGRLVGYDEALRRTTMEWKAETRHCHSVPGHPRGGIVQGGIVTGWLDAAMATACHFQSDPGTSVASLEIKVAFLLAAHPGTYRSYGKVVRIGRTIAFLEAELYDAEDRPIATATSTAAVRAAK